MFRSSFRRRGTAAAAATIGIASLSLAFAGTAGANPAPDNPGSATLIVGSGSQTSYSTMIALTDLFNTSPGCDTSQTASLPLTLGCGSESSTYSATADPAGEQGYNVAQENPYNDYTVQAPPVGSGNGATQLEHSGAGSGGTTVIDYSRASSHKGNATDNDVAYAIDGVSWTTFNEVNGVKTAQNKVTNISLGDLTAIWEGTQGCTVKGVVYTMNWICETGGKAAPIDVYIAQSGSGTYSTWTGSSGLGLTNTATPPVTNLNGITGAGMEAAWPTTGTDPITGQPYASETVSAHEGLFENQMSTIFNEPDAANAIYFMSYGKFTTTCTGKKLTAEVCQGTKGKTYTTYGQINAVAASQTTIQDALTSTAPVFPITRELYNLYNNSTATNPSNQATLNFMSEDGFLCKAATAVQIDPITGNTYRSEIEAAITANGFFPLAPGGTAFPEIASGTTLSAPAQITDTGYLANDTLPSGVPAGNGFCLVTNG